LSLLNIHKIKGHWDQNGQHPTCPTKHKYISKNQILLYHQAQHSGLIGFQALIPKVQRQREHTHNSSHFFSILVTLYNDHK
jgi:hypothetical protein